MTPSTWKNGVEYSLTATSSFVRPVDSLVAGMTLLGSTMRNFAHDSCYEERCVCTFVCAFGMCYNEDAFTVTADIDYGDDDDNA